MKLILNPKLKYYTKEILKYFNIVIIGIGFIIAIILIKYKPIYKVTISGEEIGYVQNKKEFKESLKTSLIEENKNAVNAIISTVIIVTASHFKNPTAEASPSPPSAAFPIPAAMYAHIMGIISRSEQVMRTSINIIDTAYFAPDEV